MDNLVDLDDFDDDDFDGSSWGGQSNQLDTVSETLSARNHDEDEDLIPSKKNDYVPQQEYNPHESEEMDPMMFGQVDHNESFDDFDNEHFEESHQEEKQAQESPSPNPIRTIDDLEDSDDDDFDDNFELSDDDVEEDEQTNSFRIVKKTESPPKEEQIAIPSVPSTVEEKQVTESFESNESDQLENVNFEKQYRTLDDYDDYSDDEAAQEEINDSEEIEQSQVNSINNNKETPQELPQNNYLNQPYSQSIRSDSYRNFDQKSIQDQNFAKTLPPKINYKPQQESQKETTSSLATASTLQKLALPISHQPSRSQSSIQNVQPIQQEQQSTISSQKQTLQPNLSSKQSTLQSNQNSILQRQTSTLKFTLPSTYSPKSENEEDDLENYNPIQSIKISPKVKPLAKNINIESTVVEDNRSDKSSSSTKSVPVSSQPTTKENLEKVFLSLKSKEDFKVRESEITSPKRPEKKREERILKEDCIFYPVKENQSKYISLEEIAKRNNTLRTFNMETIMSEALSRKTSKRQVDLRDDKILQLVLDLYFSVSCTTFFTNSFRMV
ncbi:predicted protein [Naegleria gruberi]|uniref:Predicted protein n=1 Tax=Naegleria gruberi TaxID=5762 RepID=D2VWM7_NAEGR|nr:uncharacterized protein NAEGRDRAFT_52847 [Naegleria gruberi]EFC38722.1 predicted protein [Naegleria gruberi]|eukprot:XP_002671466.1 predicted protein [Naegleria gruberi strain NEG-M]